MRRLFVLLLMVALCPAAEAADTKGIAAFCNKMFKERRKRARCVKVETQSAATIAELRATAESGLQKDTLATCGIVWAGSYTLQIKCINEVMDKFESATARGIPAFDTTAYCTSIRIGTGGSYAAEKTCRGLEDQAYRNIDQVAAEMPADTMAYCAKIAHGMGGSYAAMETCIITEIQAKASLR